jgi:hypothetical protein
MRHEYELTFLTKDTLEDHVKVIADEMGLESGRYLYKILSGEQTDPFSPFRHYFRAVARTRPEQAKLYLEDLKSLIPAERPKRGASETISNALVQVTKSYLGLMTAQGSDADKDELKAHAARLVAHGNQLMQILDPPRPMVIGDKERRA